MLFHRIIKKCYIMRLRNRIGYLGDYPVIHINAKFKNPQYLMIGNDFFLGRNGRIEAWDSYNSVHFTPQIIVGNNVKIGERCHIGCINRIEIDDDCLFGSNVMIIDHAHGRSNESELMIPPVQRDLYSKGGIYIGKRVWVCENVVVLSGVRIGDGAIIAAGSVVREDVPENCVVAGNPAVVVKKIRE